MSIWLGALKLVTDETHWLVQAGVQFAPIWGIILLGIYAVAWIAYGVVTLKDNPRSAKELEEHVKEAKVEMKKRGIVKD